MINKKLIYAPFDDRLPAKRRTEIAVSMSDLVMQVVTYVICRTMVDCQQLLQQNEQLRVAHAFLQRALTTHLSNHKLTTEGIVYSYQGQAFELHEEYKTTILTRSVYEHLVTFYFLFAHPKSAAERSIVWLYWQINSKKNLLSATATASVPLPIAEQQTIDDIEQLRNQIKETSIGQQCWAKLDKWTSPHTLASNGCIAFTQDEGRYDVKRVSYSQAWRYLFDNEQTALLYRQLSIHCHPIYDGLIQYQSQAATDEGNDAIPLYFSSSFLAQLCLLFLGLLPDGNQMTAAQFSTKELKTFRALAKLV